MFQSQWYHIDVIGDLNTEMFLTKIIDFRLTTFLKFSIVCILWEGLGTLSDLKASGCPFAFQICTRSRRCVYSWWSSSRLWPSWDTFLELPNVWWRFRSRHRHNGKTNGQWPPSGMRGNNQRNRRSLQQLWDGIFQYGKIWPPHFNAKTEK